MTKHKSAWANFQRLSYSHRKEYVQWIEAAKKAETKQRRMLTAVEKLATGESGVSLRSTARLIGTTPSGVEMMISYRGCLGGPHVTRPRQPARAGA